MEAVDILVKELSILLRQDWDRVPDLKKEKVVFASRFHATPASSSSTQRVSDEAVAAIVTRLDDRSQQEIQIRLDLIVHQIVALQELHFYWHECRNISFRKVTREPVGNAPPVV